MAEKAGANQLCVGYDRPLPINVVNGGTEIVNVVVTLTDVRGGHDVGATTTMIPEGVVSTVRLHE